MRMGANPITALSQLSLTFQGPRRPAEARCRRSRPRRHLDDEGFPLRNSVLTNGPPRPQYRPKTSPNSSITPNEVSKADGPQVQAGRKRRRASNAGGPQTRGAASFGRKERGLESVATPRIRTLKPNGNPLARLWGRARPSGRSGTRPGLAGEQHKWVTARLPLAQRSDQLGQKTRIHACAGPVLGPNQRPLRHHACAHYSRQGGTHAPQPASTYVPDEIREPRPLLQSHAPAVRQDNKHMRNSACLPPPPLLCGPSLSALCHLTVVVAGSGCGGASSVGRLLPHPSARARARSPPSLRFPPPSGTGRSKSLPGARGPSWPPSPRVPMEPPNLYPVKLYVYDLSKGLARRLSPIMLGEGEGARWAGGREPGQRVAAGRGGETWATTHGETHGPEDGRKAEWRREWSEVWAL